jgi:hypothetical protein
MEKPVWNNSTEGYISKDGTFSIVTIPVEVEVEGTIVQVADYALYVNKQGTKQLWQQGCSVPELMAIANRIYEIEII